MSSPETPESLNFIEQIIEDDLQSGKHTNIQTRFPPEPNGYLHIGHAKSIELNFGLAGKYNGQCNLRSLGSCYIISSHAHIWYSYVTVFVAS